MITRILLVLVGGAVGSLARYLVSLWMTQQFGAAFPWGTLTVNVVGSFLIGLIAALADDADLINLETRLLLVTGVLGGFTTFSAFSLETLRLAESGHTIRAGVYVVGSLLLTGVGVLVGTVVGRLPVR